MCSNDHCNNAIDLSRFVGLVFSDFDVAIHILVNLAIGQLPSQKWIAVMFYLLI
jgi:hypothetical protein